MPPIAETVAGADPEIAPNNMQAKIAAMPRPPVVLPTTQFATLISRLEIPPVAMILPAIMKNGSARSVKFPTLVYIAWVTNVMEVTGSTSSKHTMDPASAIPIGTPISSIRNIVPKKIT